MARGLCRPPYRASAREALPDGARPALDLDFLAGSLPADVTLTRASTGWHFNSAGTLTSAATNAARFDHDPSTLLPRGLLLEPAATNIFLNSATGATQDIAVSAVAYTLSFYGTGTVTLSGVSTAGPLVGTGATARVSLTFTPTAGTLTCTVSGTVANAQLETGAAATSPIVTVGSSVTRALDSARIASLGSWFSATAGTVLVDVASAGTVVSKNILSVSDNTANELYQINTTSGGAVRFSVTDGGVAQAGAVSGHTAAQGATFRAAAAFAANDFAVTANGAALGTDAAGTLPTVDRLYLGASGTGGSVSALWVRRLRVWPTRLPNAQLQALTA